MKQIDQLDGGIALLCNVLTDDSKTYAITVPATDENVEMRDVVFECYDEAGARKLAAAIHELSCDVSVSAV